MYWIVTETLNTQGIRLSIPHNLPELFCHITKAELKYSVPNKNQAITCAPSIHHFQSSLILTLGNTKTPIQKGGTCYC